MSRVLTGVLVCVVGLLSALGAQGQSQSRGSACAGSQKLLAEAEQLMTAAQFAQAAPKLTKAVEESPTCADAYLLLGRCQVELSQIPDAGRSYRKALELRPEDSEAKDSLAAVSAYEGVAEAADALKNRRWGRARTILYQLTEGQPERLGPIITAISWRYEYRHIAAFADLMQAYGKTGRFNCMDEVEKAWRRSCPDCVATAMIYRLPALIEAGDPAVEKTRQDIIARLNAGEPFLASLPSVQEIEKVMAAGGWSYSQPQALTHPVPPYTSAAVAAKAQGSVLLEATIERDGRVGDLRVIRSLEPSLDRACLLLIKREWTFSPATLEGRAIRVRATIDVNFSLQ